MAIAATCVKLSFMLEFDENTARQLEIAYQGADIVRRRRASFDAIAPLPDETIIDIGCGNGLLTAELARAVGPGGRIIGIEPSAAMRAAATQRCEGLDWVALLDGLADDLPLADGRADKAAALQLFEYLPDLAAPLREAFRVLRSGGRLVVADIHFDSWIWHSDNPARMKRMMAAWDKHLARRDIPAVLPPQLVATGFGLERIDHITLCDWSLKPDGLANMMMHLMQAYITAHNLVPKSEVAAWATEQGQRARDGRFFFSITQFVISAVRP